MANDFILITVTTENQTFSQQLKNLAGAMGQIYAQMSAVRNKMSHMFEGGDFSRIEKEWGIPAGQGQAVYDLINGALSAADGTMQNPNFKTITEKLG
jgi:hypothetical protein